MDLFKSLGKAMSLTNDDGDASGGESNMLRGSTSTKAKRKASPESPGESAGGTAGAKKKKKSLADKIMSPFSMLNPFDTAEADVKKVIDAQESALGGKKSAAGGAATTARKGTGTGSPTAAGGRSRSESMRAAAGRTTAGAASGGDAPRVVHTAATLASTIRAAGRQATSESGVHGGDTEPLAAARSADKDSWNVGGTGAAPVAAKRSGVFGTAAAGGTGAASLRPQTSGGLSGASSIPNDHPWIDKPRQPSTSATGLALSASNGVPGAGSAYHGLTSLQGTSRVRYQCSTLVQGNMVHFVIVVVDDVAAAAAAAAPDVTAGGQSVGGDGGGGSKCLALIGLLEPLGSVRSSSKAILQRCAAIRKLERVRISPREREMSLALLFDKSDPLLVDPEQAPVMGLILPFLRPLQGVSTVDGYRAEFWVACDASGLHKAPLFDVEGPIDELNQAAVLRLRCHDMRREEIRPQGALPTSDVSTQTVVQEARSMLQRDFDAELEQLKSDQRKEVDGLKVEVRALRIELENCRHDAAASAKTAQATETALIAEIESLKKQLAARVSATQTCEPAVAVSTQVSSVPSDADGEDSDVDGDHVVVGGGASRRGLSGEPSGVHAHRTPTHQKRKGTLQVSGEAVDPLILSPTPRQRTPDAGPSRSVLTTDANRYLSSQVAAASVLEAPVYSLTPLGAKVGLTTDPTLLTPLQYSQVSRARETEDVLAKVRDRIAKSEAYLKKSSSAR